MQPGAAAGEIRLDHPGRRPRAARDAARRDGRGLGMIGMRARARSAGGDVDGALAARARVF